MHFRLAIECTFLLEGEKSDLLKEHRKRLSALASTRSMRHYYK